MAETQIEFKICWAASSNATFRDEGEWHKANPGETQEEIEESLSKSSGPIGDGLELAINESGFEWWIETREVGEPDA